MKIEKEIEKFQTFDSSYFFGKSHFEDNRMQNYLVFWQIFKYFKTLANSSKIIGWRPKRLSEESIKTFASDKRLDSGLNCINSYKKQVKLDESFLNERK